MTNMKKVRHRTASKTVDLNDEIQYLGDGGQQPETKCQRRHRKCCATGCVSTLTDAGISRVQARTRISHSQWRQIGQPSSATHQSGERRRSGSADDVPGHEAVEFCVEDLRSGEPRCFLQERRLYCELLVGTGNSIFALKRCLDAAHMGSFTCI